jgi:hypothetical protein
MHGLVEPLERSNFCRCTLLHLVLEIAVFSAVLENNNRHLTLLSAEELPLVRLSLQKEVLVFFPWVSRREPAAAGVPETTKNVSFKSPFWHLFDLPNSVNDDAVCPGGLIREDGLCAYASTRRQFADTSTYERSSAATDGHPSSFRVRSTSARRISSARATPASPAAARP